MHRGAADFERKRSNYIERYCSRPRSRTGELVRVAGARRSMDTLQGRYQPGFAALSPVFKAPGPPPPLRPAYSHPGLRLA